jgi:N-acetylmuramoyl-L-alanine amidase
MNALDNIPSPLGEGGVRGSNYYWLLDAGHGGIDKQGNYTTAPAKMFSWGDGLVIYEGVINRIITHLVAKALHDKEIDCGLVFDDVLDTPLAERVRIADNVFAKDSRAVYLSIHSNAGGGSGYEIFTSPGQNKSDKLAHIFCTTYIKHFPNFQFRSDKSDGDFDKEADFYVLRKTDCPALLVENLFFDNRKEALYLLSSEGQQAIANCIVDSILMCELLKPI